LLFPDAPAVAQPTPRHAPDTILVRFRASALPEHQALAHSLVGAHAYRHFKMVEGLHAVRVPPGMQVKQAIALYQRLPAVLYAEPNWIVERQVTPNDPRLGELWGLHNTGQSGGLPNADIDAPGAWDMTTGSTDVVVTVIDTGIDYTHPDLAANMFRNTLDCNSNGIDDDGNGYIDDCFGIDTANKDSDPRDDNDHGSHVAGTIGAVGNNGLGVVGINWAVRLMACKFLDAAGTGTTADAIECLDYVKLMKDRGANVVATNNSWSGGPFSQALFDAIEAHRQRGILFIAAAGNNSSNNDAAPSYPANYYLPNIISVAATTRTDAQASFSNFGRRTVHLGAPGNEILSTTRGNTYSVFSGTSMATPHVTGVAALLKAQNPNRDWRAIKNLILAGGDTVSSLANTITQKRLNARGALTCSNSTVLSRLLPVGNVFNVSVGTPIDLAVLHINCANPNGSVSVTVEPGGQIVSLLDDGLGSDQAAGDGIYSGQWMPSSGGNYTLTFPGGDVVTVQVQALTSYVVAPTTFSYRTIAGTNLNLGDDLPALITSPFPIRFGDGSFSTLFVSSNGNVNFSQPFINFFNAPIPTPQIATLVAPWWDDLFPVPGTAQNVFWDVTGTAPSRELVIEWRDVRHYTCNSTSTATVRFQVVFFEGSSNLLFNYADTAFGGGCTFADRGGSASVGVQISPSLGTQFSFETQSLSDNSALLWTTSVAVPPTISVTPSSRSFGRVPLGTPEDRTFTVQNTGGGVVSGAATTSAPFLVVAGGSYALSMGQSQRVTVRFSPTSTGMFAGNVTFSGAGEMTRSVTGTGIAVSPLAPSGLTATAVAARQISLAWRDNSGNDTEFRIERKTGPAGTFGQIATLGTNIITYADAGLGPSTTYVYRVRACNAVGCSGYSNEATATTPSDVVLTLTVAIRGSAGGTVSSAPAGIGCGSGCSANFATGTMVTLTAMPGGQASFKSWSGACGGTARTCTVAMSTARSVTATFSMILTDPTVIPRSTTVRAVHVTDLRSAVNTLRGVSGLPAFGWTDATLSLGGTVVMAVHFSELRTALNEAYQRAGLALPTYTDPALAARETILKAVHLSELRSAVRGLE
jgi:subtilisin family serine protease